MLGSTARRKRARIERANKEVLTRFEPGVGMGGEDGSLSLRYWK